MRGDIFYTAAVPFEAARRVEILPQGQRSRRLHGHSFLARARVSLPQGLLKFPGAETKMLMDALSQCIVPLDYNYLNNEIDIPTDENIARWVREHLDIPSIDTVGIQSTSNEGADLDQQNRAHIWRRFRFEAAHQLPNVPEGHKCGRMHGHGFEVILHAEQDLGKSDMGVDFDLIETCWRPLHKKLNYACLNEISGLKNPTSEVLAAWLWDRLKPQLPELTWVTVYETRMAGCHYDGIKHRIWKEQHFESALCFTNLPDNDPLHRLHGHSYILRFHLTAPLDEVMGWVLDYGDVKELFKPYYKLLDHHRLDKVEGLRNSDLASLLCWVKEKMSPSLPQLDRLDIYETPGCGATLYWGQETPSLPV